MSQSSQTTGIPEELSGGYQRVDLDQARAGADVAVLYTASDTSGPTVAVDGMDPASLFNAANGRNYHVGEVDAVESVENGVRLTVTGSPDRTVDRLVVEPAQEDPDVDGVFADTPARRRLLGRFEALYTTPE